MIGTSFSYIDYLPKPRQARGVQIDIKSEKVGLRYPVEIGLVGDPKLILTELLPLLLQKHNLEFLTSKQNAIKNWNNLLKEQGTRNDKPIKPQVIAKAVSSMGFLTYSATWRDSRIVRKVKFIVDWVIFLDWGHYGTNSFV
jgi:pyruvate dehydrogenase (quinone)/pyruvate oxidase